MYIDLEGVKLSREGTISILTLMIDIGITTRRVCLIDVHSLSAHAFSTAGVKQKTLKDTLEDEKIPKVFFDVRNDSDALFAQFGVALQGVEDVQVMESATGKTTASRRLLSGLSKRIETNMYSLFGNVSQESWKQTGKRRAIVQSRKGGSYEVFNQRPIPQEIVSYCVGDVICLPELRKKFWDLITDLSVARSGV